MRYVGEFSDINSNVYTVEIRSGTDFSNPKTLTLATDSPVVISGVSDGLFSPIKSRSCSINIYFEDYDLDLYEPTSRGTRVRVWSGDKDHPSQILFFGYLTPCSYNQTYTGGDVVTLEAIDAVSSCKDFKWISDGTYKNCSEIFRNILQNAGYSKIWESCAYYMINDYNIGNQNPPSSYLKVSSANFIDNDQEQTPFKEYEVLEQLLQYIGYSLVPFGEDVYLIDYKSFASRDSMYFYNIGGGVVVSKQINICEIGIDLTNEAGGTPNISIDDIYNKISISDNLYPIEDIVPDIFDDINHISITDEIQQKAGVSALNVTQWTNVETKNFLWWETDRKTTITGWDYQTICRLKPSTGWTHRYYLANTSPANRADYEIEVVDGDEYYDQNTMNNSMYTQSIINKYINTQGCLIQHYAHRKNEGKNNLPASIDWTDILTFFINNDTLPTPYSIYDVSGFELPVLEYQTSEAINFTPSTGTSWLTIKGDLYYQYNGAKEDKKTLSIVTGVSQGSKNTDPLIYTTAPVDKSVDINEMVYCGLNRKPSEENYGEGYRMWKFKLQVGDKYWNGDNWTSIESTFYINYNNNPDGDKDENVPAFTWCGTVNNKSFKDKAGVDGYCIPIYPSDNISGRLKLTIYTPCLVSPDVIEKFKNSLTYQQVFNSLPWYILPPVIYCKDFEFGYVYTDSSVWYSNHDDEDKNDKVYTGWIDENFVNEFSDIEFKVNSAIPDKPISKSYVTVDIPNDKGYLKTMRHIVRGENKIQEYNIIDNYLDHYSERKVVYECNLHGYFNPYDVFIYDELDIDSRLVIDTQSWDIRQNNNRIKLIQF